MPKPYLRNSKMIMKNDRIIDINQGGGGRGKTHLKDRHQAKENPHLVRR